MTDTEKGRLLLEFLESNKHPFSITRYQSPGRIWHADAVVCGAYGDTQAEALTALAVMLPPAERPPRHKCCDTCRRFIDPARRTKTREMGLCSVTMMAISHPVELGANCTVYQAKGD